MHVTLCTMSSDSSDSAVLLEQLHKAFQFCVNVSVFKIEVAAERNLAVFVDEGRALLKAIQALEDDPAPNGRILVVVRSFAAQGTFQILDTLNETFALVLMAASTASTAAAAAHAGRWWEGR